MGAGEGGGAGADGQQGDDRILGFMAIIPWMSLARIGGSPKQARRLWLWLST